MKTSIYIVLLCTLLNVVACNNKKSPTAVTTPAAMLDSADQVMFGTRFALTNQGVSNAYLVSDTALFFKDNTVVKLNPVTTTFYNNQTGEKNAVLISKRGTYFTQTGTMIADGNVDIKSVDGRELTSQEVKYDQIHNQILSDSAFILTEPDRRIEGIGFRSDPNLQNIHVLKVNSGSAGSVTVPNQ